MFALHETTRKAVCRLAFFALCVAPTLVVAAWVGGRHWPGRKERISQELGQRAGVHLKLADWREPRPGLIRSSGITASDTRTALGMFDVAGVEVRTSGRVRLCLVHRATVECEQLGILAARINAWLSSVPAQDQELRVAELEFNAGGARFTLNNVQGSAERDPSGRLQARLTGFAVSGKPSDSQTVRLTLAPSSDKASASPVLSLETSIPIPARVLEAVAPGFSRFGKTASFQGSIHWTLDSRAVYGSMSGRVEKADLAALLPAGSPHEVRGMATIVLDDLRWNGDRLERLAGSIRSDRAQASQSLVEALERNFRCPRATAGQASAIEPSIIELDAIAMRFQLDEQGLTLLGTCPVNAGAASGCLAVSGGRAMVMQPPFHVVPVGVLVQTLSAPPPAWLPATREAVEMAERLPLPNAGILR